MTTIVRYNIRIFPPPASSLLLFIIIIILIIIIVSTPAGKRGITLAVEGLRIIMYHVLANLSMQIKPAKVHVGAKKTWEIGLKPYLF